MSVAARPTAVADGVRAADGLDRAPADVTWIGGPAHGLLRGSVLDRSRGPARIPGPVPGPGMMDLMLVLVVEDDPAVRASLERSLAFEGYQIHAVMDGESGLAAIAEHRPDVVLLDLGLPGMDGLEVCRRLRARGDATPVLMLTARECTRDRVTGLDAGADDYLPKPFALEELLARLRAVLRRAIATAVAADVADVAEGEVLELDGLCLNLAAREVRREGREIALTRTEFDLLAMFLRHPRQVLTRAQLLREVWGFDFDPGSNTLEVYVGYLRRKLEDGGRARMLHTVRGVGYVLKPAV